jgi:glutathione synthase/RimK-type ligase-like ATP-grasp enzyme
MTGARSPAALEFSRLLVKSDVQVFLADSLRFPVSRSSRTITEFFHIPAPVDDLEKYIKSLEEIIRSHQIDLFIPLCEEVFYVSKYLERLSQICTVFCDSHEKLLQFHHKFNFLKSAEGLGIGVPTTQLIRSTQELARFKNESNQYVFKAAYTRFAANTLIQPSFEDLMSIEIAPGNPWVAQQFLKGKEYCSFSVAVRGNLTAFSCYYPKYRLGAGSGVFYEEVQHSIIQTFVENFVRKHEYTGLVGFDFIEVEDGQVFVIECNPRSTSGIHLFSGQAHFVNCFELSDSSEKSDQATRTPIPGDNRMITFGMLLCFFQYVSPRLLMAWIRDVWRTRDALFSWSDFLPPYYMMVSFGEIIYRSVTRKTSLHAAGSADTEWNG